MRFIYSEWNEQLLQKLRGLRDMMAIFNYLLLRLNGNPDQALKYMNKLQQMGLLPEEFNLKDFKEQLLDNQLVNFENQRLRLTKKGECGLRQDTFRHIFEKLRPSGVGTHEVPYGGGSSEEPLPERKEYTFGDDLRNLDFRNSIFNSVKRSGALGFDMSEEDLEIYDSEQTTSCATVMLIDISHSMVLYGEDRITPAKQVAIAFTELILTKYPRDSLNIVVFGDFAKEVQVKDLPYIGAGPYHTNTRAGLQMARQILMRKKNANKQIFMITDGKPSMITRSNGTIYKNPIGLDPMIVNRTLDEAVVCRKRRIPITTFMIAEDPYLQQFVAKLTELNRGRAYFSSADNLGDYILWDFVGNRRKKK